MASHKNQLPVGCQIVVCLLLTLSSVRGQQIDLEAVILEEQPPGTFVYDVAAGGRKLINVTDEVFNTLTYQLFSKGNANAKLFDLNENSGRMVTADKIDREAVCPDLVNCILELDLAIYKTGEPLKFIRIGIDVKDMNDHPPVFPQLEVSLLVSELIPKNYVILTSAATDLDTGTNNSIQVRAL